MISQTHLHAMIIHFPIVLLMTGFLSEVVSLFQKRIFFRTAAFYLLLLGTFGTIFSYISGNAAGSGIQEGTLGKIIHLHKQAATFALWLSVITAMVYIVIFTSGQDNKWIKVVIFILFTATVAAIARTGYWGGQLVYKHGAGIELGLPGLNEN